MGAGVFVSGCDNAPVATSPFGSSALRVGALLSVSCNGGTEENVLSGQSGRWQQEKLRSPANFRKEDSQSQRANANGGTPLKDCEQWSSRCVRIPGDVTWHIPRPLFLCMHGLRAYEHGSRECHLR